MRAEDSGCHAHWPAAMALISVALFLVPFIRWLRTLPTSKTVSKKLAALASIRHRGNRRLMAAFRSWVATRRLLREWLANAVQIKLIGTSIPTFRIINSFPIIAVVGTFRPRLFLAEQFSGTERKELTAAIAHEVTSLGA